MEPGFCGSRPGVVVARFILAWWVGTMGGDKPGPYSIEQISDPNHEITNADIIEHPRQSRDNIKPRNTNDGNSLGF